MLKRIFPFLGWFEGYKAGDFRADLISGVTVALVLIPQSMAYAQLAGLPPYYGLYAAFLPPMVAALFGSSRQLATGPVAVVSLMTAATLEPLATAGSEGYIAYALFLALLVGLFQFSLGLLRLGVVVNFLSHPVVIGFTNAAAIIIATSQLSKMFGVSVDKAAHHYETIWRVIVAAWNFTHWPTLLLGLLAFAIMYGLKRWNPRIPFVLAAVAVTTLIAWGIGLRDDRQAPVEALHVEGIEKKIARFNADTRDIKLMGKARAELGPEVEQLRQQTDGLCTSCHSRHQVTLDMLRDEEAAPAAAEQVLPRTSLELHAMAGLLDRHIAELKAHTSDLRKQLRSMKLTAVERGDRVHFYPAGEAPQDGSRLAGTWRLKVGNTPLDPEQLTLMGGGAVVGTIPPGLPGLMLPSWDWSVFSKLLVAAIIISILGFMEAISIAKAMAARTGQRLDPNQELIGQGLANILGSVGQSYAVSGSFSRSAVNIQAGAVSGLSSVFTSAVVVIVLLLFTPLLYHLPQSVLAAVIMMAVIGLINIKGIVHAWRVQPADGAISIITFAGTLAFAPHLDRGILIGVVLSVGVFLYRKMKPAIAELSLDRDGHLHSAGHRGLALCKHIAVVRFEGPLFFANSSYLEDEVLARLRAMPELRAFVFSAEGINELDASAEETLSLLIDRLRAAGHDVYFGGVNERMIEVMRRAHLLAKIGEDHLFPTAALAVDAIWDRIHRDSDEKICPLVQMVPRRGEAEEVRLKVLLVDDEVEFANYTAKRMVQRKLDVDTANDGRTAIEMLGRQDYDVALVDLAMPGMDGLELFQAVQKRWPDLPVIIVTGHGTVDSAVESMRGGVADFVQKPFDLDELVGKIRAVHHGRD